MYAQNNIFLYEYTHYSFQIPVFKQSNCGLLTCTRIYELLTLTPKALLLNNKNPTKSNNCLCCLGS